MADLKHQPVGNYPWGQWIRRADIPQIVKVVALILATYANPDGSNVRVSETTLADEAMISDVRYLRDALRVLTVLGLIEITKHGRKLGVPDTYQLTAPGPGFPAVPMRRDPEGRPIGRDGQPLKLVDDKLPRPKPLALRPFLAVLQEIELAARPMPINRNAGAGTGNGLPEHGDDHGPATGNALPEQDPGEPGTGNPLPEDPVENQDPTGNALPEAPVDNPTPDPDYRQPVAGTGPPNDDRYRQSEGPLPATGCRSTGNPLPVTNSYQLQPTGSSQVTASPTETIKPVDNHDIVITDEEYSAARALLATLPDFGAALQVEAEAELALRNIHDAPIPLIITRAAGIATQLKDRP